MKRTIQTPVWIALTALIAAALLGGLATAQLRGRMPEALFTVSAQTDTQMVFAEGFAPVVSAAAPAVVNIWSTRVVRETEGTPFRDDSFWRRYFEGPMLRQERSLGSGVIVSPSGYILTNNHVIEGAADIRVTFADDREVAAVVVGTDPPTDIAVLRIDDENLPSLPFGDSTRTAVGDLVLAIGNPFGLGSTVTMGIVSATGRSGLGIEDYEDFIQTDAAINPGSSGGALVNIRGELIGINAAILTPTGGNLGIGFAIPSNLARYVLEQIVTTGRVVRGWMGVNIQDVSPELARELLLDPPNGVLVGEIAPGSPADRAGLQPGDVIVELDGKPAASARQLQLGISTMAPGTSLRIQVLRNGARHDMDLVLKELPTKPDR